MPDFSPPSWRYESPRGRSRDSVVVLYEDSRAGNNTFGPHDLLVAMVADEIGADFFSVAKQVKALPLKGVTNVLCAIKDLDRLSKLRPGGAPVVAVLDSDRIRDHAEARDKTLPEIEEMIRRSCAQTGLLTVVLLEKNVETLIAAARDCDQGVTLSRDMVDAALAKDLNQRDILLAKVAHDVHRRTIRDCIRGKVPSFGRAVAAVVAARAA